MSVSQVISTVLLCICGMSIGILFGIRVSIWYKMHKIKAVRMNLHKKLTKMMNNPINRLMLKCAYLASVQLIAEKGMYVDPEFTFVVDGKAIKITSNEIVDVMLKEVHKHDRHKQ